MLVLTRVASFVAFFPLFSKKQLPNLVKVGLAAALSFFWMAELAEARVDQQSLASTNVWVFALLVIQESLVGVALAFAMGLFFWPAKVAGAYVGQELGLSLASISDPGSQDGSTLVTRIFETFAILIFFIGNLHHFVILSIHFSFNQMPSHMSIASLPSEQMIVLLCHVADQGLMLAAPLLVLFMMVTLVLALLNRAAPALNLFSVGMSIRSGLGILCLLVFCPVFLSAMYTQLQYVQQQLEDLLRTLVI